MMRFILHVLLVLISLELVRSLECYVCLTPTPSDQCTASRNCSEQQPWCITTVYGPTSSGFPFKGSRYVVRDCVDKCEPSNPSQLGVIRPVFCCQEDRCNTASGARRGRVSLWALAVIVGYVCTALYAT